MKLLCLFFMCLIQMMQPATIALPAQAVPIPQPPIQQTAPVVKAPTPAKQPLLSTEPIANVADRVHC